MMNDQLNLPNLELRIPSNETYCDGAHWNIGFKDDKN